MISCICIFLRSRKIVTSGNVVRVKFATSMQSFYSFLYKKIFIFVQIYRMRCVGRMGYRRMCLFN